MQPLAPRKQWTCVPSVNNINIFSTCLFGFGSPASTSSQPLPVPSLAQHHRVWIPSLYRVWVPILFRFLASPGLYWVWVPSLYWVKVPNLYWVPSLSTAIFFLQTHSWTLNLRFGPFCLTVQHRSLSSCCAAPTPTGSPLCLSVQHQSLLFCCAAPTPTGSPLCLSEQHRSLLSCCAALILFSPFLPCCAALGLTRLIPLLLQLSNLPDLLLQIPNLLDRGVRPLFST